MIYISWPTVEWRFTGDGILTFLGGLFAVLAIRYQVRHADDGLRQQIAAERELKAEEARQANRSVAVAMVFELDTFYLAHVRGFAELISQTAPDALPPLRKTPPDPFVIYKSNGSWVGRLPVDLVTLVVRTYAASQWLLDRIADYQSARERALGHDSKSAVFQFALATRKELIEVYRGAEATLCETIRALCEFSSVAFLPPLITVAGDRRQE